MIDIVLTQKKRKTKYIKKEISYSFECEKKKNNKEIKGFNLENKIELQKSTCSVCDKKNQLLLKRVKNKKIVFTGL